MGSLQMRSRNRKPGPRAHKTPFPCWDLSLRDMVALCPHFQSQEERSVISPCLYSCHTDGKGGRCWAQHFLLYAGDPSGWLALLISCIDLVF